MTRRQAVIGALEHRGMKQYLFTWTSQNRHWIADRLHQKMGKSREKIGSCIVSSSIGDGPHSCLENPVFFRMNSVLSGTATARTRTLALWKSRR